MRISSEYSADEEFISVTLGVPTFFQRKSTNDNKYGNIDFTFMVDDKVMKSLLTGFMAHLLEQWLEISVVTIPVVLLAVKSTTLN